MIKLICEIKAFGKRTNLFAACLLLMTACASAPEPARINEPSPPAVAPVSPDAAATKAEDTVPLPPPTANEVLAKVNFIFGDAAPFEPA